MSSKAKAKALADEFEDDEVASMLGLETPTPGDSEPWTRDNNGDLDWAYTARTLRRWSPDALLTHLWDKSFSIPPREYNPSAPFVWVQLASGETVTLPHGYRLPLMFVAKYRWEITLSKIVNERQWKQERSNIFHLSRLCENLFRRAQAKAARGGMEKGWRCVMFDRLLARFYKHWARNDPEGGKGFLTTHGAKEYDRDVLKHDWKRWCLRGLNGVKMTDEEVTNGITIDQFRKSLKKRDDGKWTVDGQPLAHITDEAPPDDGSSSELTEYSMDSDEDNSSDAQSGSDDEAEDAVPANNSNLHAPRQSKPSTVLPAASSRSPLQNPSARSQEKRPRDLPVDDDEIERERKRNRIQDGLWDRSTRAYDLSHTIAAMAHNPVWAHVNRTSAPGSGSTSRIAVDASTSTSIATSTPSTSNQRAGSMASTSGEPVLLSSTTPSAMANSSSQQNNAPLRTAPATSVMPPHTGPAPLLRPSSSTPGARGSTVASTSASTRPSRAASLKSKQAAAAAAIIPSPSAGANGAASATPIARSSFLTPSGSEPRRYPVARTTSHRFLAPPPPSESSSSDTDSSEGTLAHRKVMQATALELLEKLVDVKRVLESTRPATSASASAPVSAPDAGEAQMALAIGAITAAAAAHMPAAAAAGASAPAPQAGAAALPAATGSAAAAAMNTEPDKDSEKAAEEKAALEAKFNDFEGQFAAIKQELKGILDRLQVLEGATPSTAATAAAHALADGAAAVGGDEAAGMDLDAPQPPVEEQQQASATEPLGSAMGVGADAVHSGDGVGVERQSGLGTEEAPAPTSSTETEAQRQPSAQPQAEADKNAEVVGDKGSEGVKETENEGEIVKEKEADTTKDVHMLDASAQATGGAADEPSQQAIDNVPPPAIQEGEQPPSQPITPQPQEPLQHDDSAPPQDAQIQPEERQTMTEPAQGMPSLTASQSPQIALHPLDRDVNAHKHASSEPDTDITMANTTTTSASSLTLNDALDPRTRDMTGNLNLVVENLVSSKMLAIMEGMVKSRLKDREGEKDKDKELAIEGSIASSSGEADRERERELDAAPRHHRAHAHPLHTDSLALTQSAEAQTLAALVDELRALKQAARMREQREKDEMQAMRELHSAEVDALRRRLSYLEAQNQQRTLDALHAGPPMMLHPSDSGAGAYRPLPHAESSYHAHTAMHPDPPHMHMQYGGGPQYPNGHGSGSRQGHSHTRPSPESEPPAKNPEPVRIYTDRNFGFARHGGEREDEVPLPIKSQRKQHMVFNRAQYS